jgi:uncharacterized repeat protein (TIGR02543 family)
MGPEHNSQRLHVSEQEHGVFAWEDQIMKRSRLGLWTGVMALSISILSGGFVSADYVHVLSKEQTYVSSSDPGNHNGELLKVGSPSQYRAYLKFDLCDIPSGATVTGVELWTNCVDVWSAGPGHGVQIDSVSDDSWSEGSMTWANRPGYSDFLGQFQVYSTGEKNVWLNSAGVAAVDACLKAGKEFSCMLSIPNLSDPVYLVFGDMPKESRLEVFYNPPEPPPWWMPDSATISPASPTSSDLIFLYLSGRWVDTCVPNAFPGLIVGNTITIDLIKAYPPGTVCLAVMDVPWDGTVCLGTLTSGTYTVYIRYRDNDPAFMTGFTVCDPEGYVLTLSSTAGGSVTDPGEGSFAFPPGTEVSVMATADPNHQFAGWTGTAVDAGKVVDINMPSTKVVVDADYTLRAHFVPAGMVLVSIPAGTFEMGDHYNVGRSDERPVHTVTLDAFQISKYETTNAQYATYLNAAMTDGRIQVVDGVVYAIEDVNKVKAHFHTYSRSDRSQIEYIDGLFVVRSRDGYSMGDHPVGVSWYGAKAFCDCYGYRLPSEARWEYAARGGYHDPYHQFPWGGNSIDCSQANFKYSESDYCNPLGLSAQPYTTPAGYYGPQGAYGLCDMSGNLWEWCQDWFNTDYYSHSPTHNPTGPDNGSCHTLRGGSLVNPEFSCRIAVRGDLIRPYDCQPWWGFRVCISSDVNEVNEAPTGPFVVR